MLKLIKQLFTQVKQKRTHSAHNGIPDDAENPRFLRQKSRIYHLLRQLKEEGALFTISIESMNESYATTILKINSEENELSFDELNQLSGHQALLKTRKFKARASHNGVDVIFNTASLHEGSSDGIAYYRVPIPDEIYYPQRRGACRITVSSERPILLHAMISRENRLLLGQLQNISTTGVGVLVPSRSHCRRGDILKGCHMSLPDGSEIRFDLTIRVLSNQPAEQKSYLGGFFKNIDKLSYKKIERFIIKSEREQIKNKKLRG